MDGYDVFVNDIYSCDLPWLVVSTQHRVSLTASLWLWLVKSFFPALECAIVFFVN